MAASPTSPRISNDADLKKRDTITVALLFALAAGCYLNTLANGFVYDDEIQILQNPYVRDWHYLPQIFRTTVWSFIGDAGATNYYRPLMTLTFLGLTKVFGESPPGFHLFNLLLNALVVATVFYAGRALFNSHRAAVVAAVLFAVHPVHTETVNWIAAVPDLEATLFILLAFFVYVTEPWGRFRSQALVVTLFILALLAKEPALMFAPLLISYDHFVRDDRHTTTFAGKFKRYGGVLLAAVAYLGLRIALFGKLAPVMQHAQISWTEAILSGFALVAQYTKLLFWPAPLSAFHVFHVSQSVDNLLVLSGLAIVLSCALFVLLAHKRWPQAPFCVVWIGLTLAPVLNARWMAANVLTERYIYLPSVGFCWLVGWVLAILLDRLESRAGVTKANYGSIGLIGVLLVLALFAIRETWNRNRIWRDDFALYGATIQTDPDSYIMRMNLGIVHFEAGNLLAAEKDLDYALALKPDSPNVLNALACVYLEQGRLDDAAQTLKKAIALKPSWGDPHLNYGRVLTKERQSDEAISEFRTAVQVAPLNAFAHVALADELVARGEDVQAEAEYRKALELHPSLHAQQKLADVLLRAGRNTAAEGVLHKIVTEYPFDSQSHLKLAELLDNSGRTDEARQQYQATLQTDPRNQEALERLAQLKTK
jgi:protein O-mannosyl-transferase